MGTFTARLHPTLPAPRRLLRLRSDATLGERFAAGDETAFDVLYERHRATVLAVCMGVLGSRHDAEDALQDCFAALATTLQVRPPRELRPWLIRVARNAAIDIARRRRSGEYAGDAALDRAAPPDPGPAELQAVLQGIRELPESQRTALLMRELAGHTYREIADSLQIEEDAVRGLIARARIGLRDHRAAAELRCEQAREAVAVDPHHRPDDRTVRRHVKSCAGCQAYARMLRDDANALRGLMPLSGGSIAAGGAIAGGLGAKGALLGGALSQAGAACAVSVCAVGGMALVAPKLPVLDTAHRSAPAVDRASRSHTSRIQQQRQMTVRSGSSASGAVSTLPVGVTAAGVGSAAGQHRLSGSGSGVAGSPASAPSSAGAAAGHADRLTGTMTGSRLTTANHGLPPSRSPATSGASRTATGPDAGGSGGGRHGAGSQPAPGNGGEGGAGGTNTNPPGSSSQQASMHDRFDGGGGQWPTGGADSGSGGSAGAVTDAGGSTAGGSTVVVSQATSAASPANPDTSSPSAH